MKRFRLHIWQGRYPNYFLTLPPFIFPGQPSPKHCETSEWNFKGENLHSKQYRVVYVHKWWKNWGVWNELPTVCIMQLGKGKVTESMTCTGWSVDTLAALKVKEPQASFNNSLKYVQTMSCEATCLCTTDVYYLRII